MILIVNDVCLFDIKNAKQLQMSHLIFVYEKEAVFETKSGKVVAKFNGVTSSYNADAPTKNQNYRKVLAESIVPNIIDEIKIKLIERCQFKMNQ